MDAVDALVAAADALSAAATLSVTSMTRIDPTRTIMPVSALLRRRPKRRNTLPEGHAVASFSAALENSPTISLTVPVTVAVPESTLAISAPLPSSPTPMMLKL
ncbi:MAG TPA: hypothetical protein DHB48_00615 [Sphingobium sp.]|nr:hypothetical protein [Sphingobium sp.]